MFSEITTFLVILIIFCATLTRSTFGFGDALVAMPLLTIAIGIRAATPLIALVAFSTSFLIIIRNWEKAQIQAAWRLIISSLLGIPAGLFLLKHGNEKVIKTILAFVIIIISLFNLVRPRSLKLEGEKFAFIFGFIGGILGGAYNTNGPPVVIYGTLRRWNPGNFRATLQGYFLPTSISIAIGHGLSGLWTEKVFIYYLINLPFVVTAIIIGGVLNRSITGRNFINFIFMLLILMGLLLLLHTVKS